MTHELQLNSPFASFPVELVRSILELAGRADSLSASHLVLVSRPVHDWILPILYETLVISNAHQCQALYRTLSSSPALARCVKNISVRVYEGDCDPYRTTVVTSFRQPVHDGSSFQHALASIIQACHNVSNLSLTLSLDRLFRAAALEQCHTLYTCRLTRLHCASWDAWVYFSQHAHLYPNLTHLRVDTAYNGGLSDSWTSIIHNPTAILPNMSHLAFSFDSRSSPSEFSHMATLVKSLLSRRTRVLQSLVVLGWYCWDDGSVKFADAMSSGGVTDSRVRVVTSPLCLDEKVCLQEWSDDARGESGDIWERALKTNIPIKQ